MFEKANRSQDLKKSTTPPGTRPTFFGTRFVLHNYLKLIFVTLRSENLSLPVFIGYNSS